MKRRTKTILATVVMLLIMAVYSIKRGNQDADLPTHQGKTVEEWFYGTNGHPGMERGKTATRLAFDAMGTNCIPYLIRKASTRETVSNRLYCWLYKELPSRWRAKLRFPATASYIQSIAWMYIYDLELKKDTSPMAKDILEAVRQIEDDRVRPEALRMAGWLVSRTYGSTAKTYLFPFLQDPRSDVQVEAAILLSELDPTITNGLPILVATASDTNLIAQAIASRVSLLTTSPASHGILTNLAENWLQGRQISVEASLRMMSRTMPTPTATRVQSP